MKTIQTFLDRLYDACAVLAALFLVSIALLIIAQVGARWFGIGIQGLAEYAGYCMAASSFFAMAHTFRRGGHIRVMLIIQRFRGRARRVMEYWCLGAGVFLSGYLAWFTVKMARVSHKLGDISQGGDAMPLWIPQSAMAIGAVVLFISLIDAFVRLAVGGPADGADDDGILQKE